MRRLATLLATLALAGCGSEREAERVTTAPLSPPPPREPVPYTGELPGTRVSLGAHAGYLGVDRASVRRLLAVGEGRERLALLVALDRRDRSLCVGYRQEPEPGFLNVDFRCFGPGVAAPVIVFVGRAGGAGDRVDRLSLVGIARDAVAGIELRLADGATEPVTLRRLPNATFRAIAVEPRAQPFPTAVVVRDADGGVVAEIALDVAAFPPCPTPDACVGAAGPWSDAVDPTVE